MIVEFGVYWQSYGRQKFRVPDGLTKDEILEYLKEHWDEIPLPAGDYVSGSDELDYGSDVIILEK